MATQFILTDYIHDLMAQAEYNALEDGTFGGRIPGCKGVVAFANSLRACEAELHATLEDWIFVGIKLGHKLPVVKGIDLNSASQTRMAIPSNSEYSVPQLRFMIREVEAILESEITASDWYALSQ